MSDYANLGDVGRAVEAAVALEEKLMLASQPGHAEGEPYLLLMHFREEVSDIRRTLARKIDEWHAKRVNQVSR